MSICDLTLHLSLIEGVGSVTIQKIISYSQVNALDAQSFYCFSEIDWTKQLGFSPLLSKTLSVGLRDKKKVYDERFLIDKYGVSITTFGSDTYPKLLSTIYAPPAVIYWQGQALCDQEKKIAVIGSRKATMYAQSVINHLVPDFVSHDLAIVSGGALGADSMAHKATLVSGGKTIAVLGSGLLSPYPKNNEKLFREIAEKNGTVLSIFPLQAEPTPGTFPARNRIISGLSEGCIVVQAADKSGALITAGYALEQGRDVFAVPGLFNDPLSVGCHRLIQQGAKLVTSSLDVLQELGVNAISSFRYHSHERSSVILSSEPLEEKMRYKGMSDLEIKILIASKSNSVSCDDLVELTGLSIIELQSVLFNLALNDLIVQDSVGNWKST